ncbi:hypothetical protein CEXT_714801 [Caerostris extrusa]|uniref:LAGLIDADG homing endonuclease n=1 Tax=Caerostris extrusa TaxID=172846 RepID=A0AAV4XPR7_CAEEX|nr:hypothetical protein CEXT_714801 [Caerostris extrusa]
MEEWKSNSAAGIRLLFDFGGLRRVGGDAQYILKESSRVLEKGEGVKHSIGWNLNGNSLIVTSLQILRFAIGIAEKTVTLRPFNNFLFNVRGIKREKESSPSVDPVLIEKLTLMCLNYHIKRDERPEQIRRRKKPPCLMWGNNHPKVPTVARIS